MSERLVYEGKAKKIFATDEEGILLHRYKDDATAFNAQKRGSWVGKGRTNATMSAALFKFLESRKISTHFIEQVDDETIKTKKLQMLPVEVIVRNVAAGSLAKRLGYEEGTPLKDTVVELCYKSDELGDPLFNWYHLREVGVADEDLKRCEEIGLEVNGLLHPFFDSKGVVLVDFKIEVGRDENGELMLADEISPDTCRFWDKDSGEKLDKDRFRRDMGGVEQAYEEMLRRVTHMGPMGTME
ncbi:MAG: phosphoribosylaminoimidazolesuccinocarboxamide synthase [Actinobacteria bacterium]|nr:phosphoribosylaminoimidazolesuccinocarboxamide synthase [Actinomycetota bacterium]PLS83703.1 MAG: phosphoribosylaminoimidazolesuccinocarboxamide synthase [Actinomycetota bacterium]